jgi:Zinc-binding
MGKGSNVQKAQQARERNQKKLGKTDEERRAASLKAQQDAAAKMCALCRQTFMVNSRPPLLYQHIVAKHPDIVESKAFNQCFPGGELDGFDPNDPKGELKPAAAKADAAKKVVKKNTGDLDSLLDAGLKKAKK